MTRGPDRRFVASQGDTGFDRLLPGHLRPLSVRHWTPFEIAVRAASLLCPTPGARILDVGSGVGKLCVIGAMSASGTWCGIERHAPLVHTARMLASTLDVANSTRFWRGDALALDWRDFDAIYLYNPFENPPCEVDPRQREIDFRNQVARAQDRLAVLHDRVRVVTLNGFGGAMPPSYDMAYHERVSVVGLNLTMWVQRAPARPRRVLT